mmetsp:Transcript_16873/g.21899  ORF Transcript_16873/g.21899 Transcript_16873/m.21899 type:complete len:131 (+) Transcript_16873:120-512(+)
MSFSNPSEKPAWFGVWGLVIMCVFITGIVISGVIQDPTVGAYFKEKKWRPKEEKFVSPTPPFEERWFYIYPLSKEKMIAAGLYLFVWGGLIVLFLFMLECAPASIDPTEKQKQDFTLSEGLHEFFCPNPK